MWSEHVKSRFKSSATAVFLWEELRENDIHCFKEHVKGIAPLVHGYVFGDYYNNAAEGGGGVDATAAASSSERNGILEGNLKSFLAMLLDERGAWQGSSAGSNATPDLFLTRRDDETFFDSSGISGIQARAIFLKLYKSFHAESEFSLDDVAEIFGDNSDKKLWEYANAYVRCFSLDGGDGNIGKLSKNIKNEAKNLQSHEGHVNAGAPSSVAYTSRYSTFMIESDADASCEIDFFRVFKNIIDANEKQMVLNKVLDDEAFCSSSLSEVPHVTFKAILVKVNKEGKESASDFLEGMEAGRLCGLASLYAGQPWFEDFCKGKIEDFTPEQLVRLSSHYYEKIWFKNKVFKEHNCSRGVCVGASVLGVGAGAAGVGVAGFVPGVVAGLGLSVAATGGVGGALIVAAVLVLLIPVIIHRVKYSRYSFAESARGVYGGYSGSLLFKRADGVPPSLRDGELSSGGGSEEGQPLVDPGGSAVVFTNNPAAPPSGGGSVDSCSEENEALSA